MNLDFEWALKQIEGGVSSDEIRLLALKELKEKDMQVLFSHLYHSLLETPIWHWTDHLTDQEVINVFTRVGERVVEKQRHRHRSDK